MQIKNDVPEKSKTKNSEKKGRTMMNEVQEKKWCENARKLLERLEQESTAEEKSSLELYYEKKQKQEQEDLEQFQSFFKHPFCVVEIAPDRLLAFHLTELQQIFLQNKTEDTLVNCEECEIKQYCKRSRKKSCLCDDFIPRYIDK